LGENLKNAERQLCGVRQPEQQNGRKTQVKKKAAPVLTHKRERASAHMRLSSEF
jgi:ribosomal protein L29